MRFICDVNIAIRISKFLVSQGAYSLHVNQLKDKWLTRDKIIWELADEQELIVVSKDADFRESFLLRRAPKKLLHVCVGNAATEDIMELLRQSWPILEQYAVANSFYLELNHAGIVPIVA